MIRRALELLKTIRHRINERRLKPFLWFAGTGVLALGIWLGWPVLIREPYVRVQGSSFLLSASCAPESLTLRVSTKYASLIQPQLILQDNERQWAHYPLIGKGVRQDGGIVFVVVVPPKARSELQDAHIKGKVPNSAWNGFALEFARVPALDVTTASIEYPAGESNAACRNETLSGDRLAERMRGARARVMHYYVLHDALSNSIFLANEVLGNIVLGCLVLTSFWLTMQLVRSFTGVYLISDEHLARKLKGENVKGTYAETYRRLAFCRVLGPALGFLLTVSSLIAGLHPAATAAKDTFHFVSSLQLALVATFMGLAVRILAEFALRFGRDLAERKLDLSSRGRK